MHTGRFLSACAAAGLLLAASGFGDEAFEQAKRTYEEAVAKIASDLAAERAKMLATYARSLDKIMADFQAKGNLDLYLAAQREKERFGSDPSVPASPDTSLPEAVTALQERFNAAARRAERDSLKKEGALTEQYVEHLRKAVKGLVVGGQIEDAKIVDAELKRAEAALSGLAAAAAEPKPAAPRGPKSPVAAPAPARPETALKAVARGYRGDVFVLDFGVGDRHVARDPRTGGYLFDGETSCIPWDNDIPRKIGMRDFTVAFERQPAKQKTDTAYILEHHRGFPWTGLFAAIENYRSLRFRVKDMPHNDADCDIGRLVGNGRYHHVALSRHGRTLEILIDGKQAASEEQPEIADLDIDYAGNRLMVGTHCEKAPNYYAGGLRNMAAFVGEALSQREIEQLAR